jgi:hypothetical protein
VSDIFTASNKSVTTPADIACDAIFFFSYGKYSLLCPANKCAGTPSSDNGSVAALGEIAGVKASQKTIQNGSFALDRQLYNVYSDGSNGNLPYSGSPQPTTGQAVENFVSTYGFLCNPATYADVDPLSPTGATYGTEIDGIITANGFFPFKLGTEGDNSISTPPDFTDPGYSAASPAPTGDQGYCRVTTTDGDGNN